MSEPLWRLFAALTVATAAVLALAWCTTACDGSPVYTAADVARKRCIDETEGGAGRAALRKAIDACTAASLDGGAE